MIKRIAWGLFCLWIAWLVCPNTGAAQANASVGASEQLPVFVVDFKQELGPEVEGEFGGLSAFATYLVKLRLLQISSVTVRGAPTKPACENAQSAVTQSPQPVQETYTARGDFYVVAGLIEMQAPNIVLSYSVEKCEGRKLKRMFQDTEPFPVVRALDQVTVAANAIAYKIQREIPPTQVAVLPFTANAMPPAAKGEAQQPQKKPAADTERAIQDEGIKGEAQQPQKESTADIEKAIRDEVIKAVRSSDCEIADDADYKILGSITIKRGGRAFGIFSTKSDLTVESRVETHGRAYPLRTVQGTSDQLPKLYADVNDEVIRGLPEVLLAEHLNLPGVVNNMQADELANRAEHLLAPCFAPERDCSRAGDAIVLLSAAERQEPSSWSFLLMSGKAEMITGAIGDAMTSLQRAQTLIKLYQAKGGQVPDQAQVEVLNQLGDGFRSTSRYDLAIAAYDQSLGIDSSQRDIYVSKAKTLQYQGQRVASLETIIKGMRDAGQGGDFPALRKVAKDVILSIQDTDEINRAEAPLHNALVAGVPVSNEYALLVALKWDLGLNQEPEKKDQGIAAEELKNAAALQINDPEVSARVYAASARIELLQKHNERLQDFVIKAEALPSNQVPANIREWIERISALGYIDAAEFDMAARAAEDAYHIMPSDQGTYLLADAVFLRARCQERTLGRGEKQGNSDPCKQGSLFGDSNSTGEAVLGIPQRAELREQYLDVTNQIGPLVAKRYPGADTILVKANHSLGRDRQSREEYLRLVQQDPSDEAALKTLIHVCSQYLFDFACSFTAAQKMALLLHNKDEDDAREYLDIAEMAVLRGNDRAATEWLDSAAHHADLTPRDATLISLYRLWVAMLKGQSDQYKADFDSWNDAVQKFRAGKEILSWTFVGARKALDLSKASLGETKVSFLSSMIDALEDSTRALPSWDESRLR